MSDPYRVLGVAPSATKDEIKAAYRRLAKEHHPDLHGGSKTAEDRFKEIQAAYAALKDGTYVAPAPRRRNNPPVTVFCQITLEQAFAGCQVLISGQPGQREVIINIPPGVDTGQVIVARGQGPSRFPDSPPGDIHAVIRVAPHEQFTRLRADLAMRADIDVFDALLGGRIAIEGFDGTIWVTIPPSCPYGHEIRVPGRGMPRIGGGRGDMIVVVAFTMPKLNAEQIALAERIKGLQTGLSEISSGGIRNYEIGNDPASSPHSNWRSGERQRRLPLDPDAHDDR